MGGFGYGIRQEFLKATLRTEIQASADWDLIDGALAGLIPASGEEPEVPASSIADRIIRWTAELQRAGAQPVFDRGRLVGMSPDGKALTVALPTIAQEAASVALAIVVSLISGLLDGASPPSDVREAMRKEVATFVRRYSSQRLGSSNTARFLKAAHDNRIPWFRLAAGVFQFGMGSRGRWLESSLTDVTPAISMRLVRNKLAGAEVLRQTGLPVPMHDLAGTEEDAIRIAARLGYPVVVKPADRDGGIAVAAGLKDAAGVAKAYAAARQASQNVMVEKHFDGRDYRLVVFNGQLIWALERVAGGVTGDGVRSIAQLLDRLNEEPARAIRADAALKPLIWDDEAEELLAEYGMTLASVPALGERIRLRRAANIASGGTPEGVLELVHPDNRDLAVRAARALRLDLAGVDLLIPDIARSWKETGAAICEVNAQPTIGNTTQTHIYGQILKELLPGMGRIPIALIVGAGPESRVPGLVAAIMTAAGLRVGLASASQVSVAGRILGESLPTTFQAARMAIMDRDADALVVTVSEASVVKTGMPFDRCSAVVLAGACLDGSADGVPTLNTLAHLLLPLSLGSVVADARAVEWRGLVASLRSARVVLSSGGAQAAGWRTHVDSAQQSVFVDRSGDRPRLMLGHAAIELSGESGDARPACSLDEIALAASAAWVMGYSPEIIGRGLLGVRWIEPSPGA